MSVPWATGGHELRRLRDARVGADSDNDGHYAVYFYNPDGEEIEAHGGYASVTDAAHAVHDIRAKAVLEACGWT